MARTARRLDFFDMPAAMISELERAVDGEVVSARSAAGGFSPGPAGPVLLNGGRTVFIKACSKTLNATAVAMHRREATVLPLLPVDYPAPTLLATVDEGDWFALIVEFVEGTTPTAPISADEVDGVLGLVANMADRGKAFATDVLHPIGTDPKEQADRLAWTRMMADGPPSTLDPWSRRHLGQLAELEADWVEAASGDSLLHRDLRPDNMVLGAGGGIAVDWPAASIGAPWVDFVALLPALNMMGGPDPQDAMRASPVGVAAEPAAVDCFLALLTGYFTGQSLLPPVPSVPGLRRFQADQGAVCRRWLADRLDWDRP